MSYTIPFHRLSPDYQTEQGTIENPFVPFLPTTYVERRPPVQFDMRGRHQYRVQPRPIGPGTIFMDGVQQADLTEGEVEYPGRPYLRHEGVTGYEGMGYLPAYPGIQGYGHDDSKLSLILLLGVVGLIAYMIGKSNAAPKTNPMSCRRGWSGGRGRQHRTWICSRCAGGRRCRGSQRRLTMTGKHSKLSRLARGRDRDDKGRFV